jgi:uncharacterized protein (DUF58 family)
MKSQEFCRSPMNDTLRDALSFGEQAGSRYVLSVPRRLPLGVSGGHQGARAGSSLEFQEHREYSPGDDLRHIDWNAYGRSDQLVVKLFHEEVTPHLDILLDGSRSMALAGFPKAEAAAGLAAFFTAAAANAGMSHRVWLARDGCERLEGSQGRPHAWQLPAFDFAGSIADAFSRRPPAFRPRGLRVILSDLFWLGDPMQVLAPCADRATTVVVVQILARADADPRERGNLRLIDIENDQVLELMIDDDALARYREKLERHRKLWSEACRRAGATLTRVIAEDFFAGSRLEDLLALEILRVS